MASVASVGPTMEMQLHCTGCSSGKGRGDMAAPCGKIHGWLLCLRPQLTAQGPDEADFIVHRTDSACVSLSNLCRAGR